MFIAALLVVGLVALCVGLLLSSTVWLVVSLAASVLAGLLIYRNREAFSLARRRPAAPRPAQEQPSAPADGPDPQVWVIDGRPRYHREGCDIIDDQDAEAIPMSQASEDGFIPCSLCQPDRAVL